MTPEEEFEKYIVEMSTSSLGVWLLEPTKYHFHDEDFYDESLDDSTSTMRRCIKKWIGIGYFRICEQYLEDSVSVEMTYKARQIALQILSVKML